MTHGCSYFLKFEAINLWIFTLYVYGLKWGYVWHDAGPVFSLPIKQNGYLNMILFVYFLAASATTSGRPRTTSTSTRRCSR